MGAAAGTTPGQVRGQPDRSYGRRVSPHRDSRLSALPVDQPSQHTAGQPGGDQAVDDPCR